MESVEDGDIAVETVRKAVPGQYDLVLMDVQMPRMNGYEVTKKIQKFNQDIPIIAMTANAFEEDRQNTFDAGMNEHIAKPISIQNLVDKNFKSNKKINNPF